VPSERSAPTAPAKKSNSIRACPNRSVRSTGRGERKSAQITTVSTSAPMPVRMPGKGSGHALNAQKVMMSTAPRWKSARSNCVRSADLEGAVGRVSFTPDSLPVSAVGAFRLRGLNCPSPFRARDCEPPSAFLSCPSPTHFKRQSGESMKLSGLMPRLSALTHWRWLLAQSRRAKMLQRFNS